MKPKTEGLRLWKDECGCEVYRVGPIGKPNFYVKPCKQHRKVING